MPGPVPDHALVRPGHYLDSLGQRSVPGHGAQLVGIGAHHVGQSVRVGGVAVGPRGAVPLSVAGDLHRVDREHPILGRNQRRHPPTARSEAVLAVRQGQPTGSPQVGIAAGRILRRWYHSKRLTKRVSWPRVEQATPAGSVTARPQSETALRRQPGFVTVNDGPSVAASPPKHSPRHNEAGQADSLEVVAER